MKKPFQGTTRLNFRLAPKDGSSEVTWATDTNYAFIPKVVGIVMNMDKMDPTSKVPTLHNCGVI